MAGSHLFPEGKETFSRNFFEIVRRSFAEFLKIPLLILAVFLLVAALTTLLDYAHIRWLQPPRTLMREYVFRDANATSDLLATIAAGMITVTSITFSLLLLAVQQAASALTHQIYDQFLRRRINQFYFGFFVGLAVYTLVILATVGKPFNPVFGATVALLTMIVALMLLLLLLYTTINQMRPVVVIDAIHDYTLTSRKRQQAWLGHTRRASEANGVALRVRAEVHGYVVHIDLEALDRAARQVDGEIALQVSIGAYVAFDDLLAEIRSPAPEVVPEIFPAVRGALRIEQQRDLETDPAYGIEQLATIGWTSISTAKSNPSPGLLVIHRLRDLLARWSTEPADPADSGEKLRVVYQDDVFPKLLNAFETLAVVASESMQPQTITEIVRTYTLMFARLPAVYQDRADDVVRRSLSALGEHVLTGELDAQLSELIQGLEAAGRRETAALVRTAQQTLGKSIGQLGSRATRATEDA